MFQFVKKFINVQLTLVPSSPLFFKDNSRAYITKTKIEKTLVLNI